MRYSGCPKMMYQSLKSCIIMNYKPMSMIHLSFLSQKANLDVGIYFTRIGHMVLEF